MIKKLIEFYQRLSKREKIIFLGTTFVVGILATDQLIIGPASRKMKQLEQAIIDQEVGVKKSLHVLMQKDKVAVESKEFMPYLAPSKSADEETTSLLKEIETMANEAGLGLLYVKPAASAEDAGIKKYLASLECEGEMKQLAEFFYQIESSKRLLQIEKYDLQPKNKESSVVRCVMTVSKTVLA